MYHLSADYKIFVQFRFTILHMSLVWQKKKFACVSFPTEQEHIVHMSDVTDSYWKREFVMNAQLFGLLRVFLEGGIRIWVFPGPPIWPTI